MYTLDHLPSLTAPAVDELLDMVLGRKTRQSSRRARPSCSAASTFLVRAASNPM